MTTEGIGKLPPVMELTMPSSSEDDRSYFTRREAEERAKARDTSCMVSSVHRDLADLYAMQLGKARTRNG